MDTPPIIFIHFSNSSFLKYTLESAKLFNPDKRIILLGDETNNKYSHLGIEHFYFADYDYGDRLKRFDEVYQFIAGTQRVYSFKENFFFRRWFIMFNFIESHNINKFWTFDSDTLIITPLSKQEKKFEGFDNTEQCHGWCMNGYIGGQKTVTGYLDKINELFTREDYLEQQKQDFLDNPTFGFTEMRAYWAYKHEVEIITTQLSEVVSGETFDNCLFNADGMETYSIRFKGRTTLKKLYLSDTGNIYVRYLSSNQMVKLNTLNLSWLPDIFFWILFRHAKKKLKTPNLKKASDKSLKVLNIIPLILFYQFFERPMKWVTRKINP